MTADGFRKIQPEEKTDIIRIFQALFLALILNMNAIKLVLRSQSSLFTYFIFVAFVASVLLTLPSFEEIRIRIRKDLAFALFLFTVAAFAGMAFSGRDGYGMLVKFLAGILIAYLAGKLDRKTLVTGIRISVVISAVYALYLQWQYSRVLAYVKGTESSNYLTVTLPLGLGLSLALVLLILADRKGKWIALDGISAMSMFLAMTRFSARGNLLFPFAVAAVLLIFTSRRDPAKLILSLLLLAAMGMLVYFLILQFGDPKLVSRLTKLFGNTGTEKRVSLYDYYIDMILHDFRWMTGIGFGNSRALLAAGGLTEKYPHNFILELDGEMGLIGLLLLAVAGKTFFVSEKKQYGILKKVHHTDRSFVLRYAIVNAGLLFYLLTYFKSYSIYEGYQLFIFFSLLIQSPEQEEGIVPC